MPHLHFISGLPRSGSTLLAGLLRQNPRFAAAMTGPVGGLVGVLLNAMSAQNETAVFLDEERKAELLRAVIATYYRPQADRAVLFDTNRAWCARLPLLRTLFPEAKVICCVRNVAWVLDSFERLVRKNALSPTRLFATPEELEALGLVVVVKQSTAGRPRFRWFLANEAQEAKQEGTFADRCRSFLVSLDSLTSPSNGNGSHERARARCVEGID